MPSGSLALGLQRPDIHVVFMRQAQQAGRQREARVSGLATRDVADGGLPTVQAQRDFWLGDTSGFEAAQHGGPIDKRIHSARISNKRSESKRLCYIGFAYANGMASDFGKRLKAAREHAGLTQEQLAKRAGIAQSTLATAEAKGAGSRKTPQLAAVCGVDPHWLASGAGTMLPNPGEVRLGLTLEQLQKTLDIRTVVPKRTREQLMSGELGEEFEWALDDDALTPDYVRGTSLVWSTRKTPAVGSVLLLQDSAGQLHVRLLAQGRGGQRLARAPNPNYASFELDTDALRILAVAAWQPMP